MADSRVEVHSDTNVPYWHVRGALAVGVVVLVVVFVFVLVVVVVVVVSGFGDRNFGRHASATASCGALSCWRNWQVGGDKGEGG